MGLRIINNVASVTALRNLRVSDRQLQTSMQRLSTGLRINQAADDPSGLVISEQLRGQIRALRQATDNAQNASNLLGTAEASLQEVQDLLHTIRESVIFGLNTGGASFEQVEAEQDAVDRAIEAIDRIAQASRFGDKNLLNGTVGFQVLSGFSNKAFNGALNTQAPFLTLPTTRGEMININPLAMRFDRANASGQTQYLVTLVRQASQAGIQLLSNTAPTFSTVLTSTNIARQGPMTLRITGSLGTEEIQLRSSATAGELMQAVNTLRNNLGIYASNNVGTLGVTLYTEDFGEKSFIRVEQVSPTSTGPSTTTNAVINRPAGTTNQAIIAGNGAGANIRALGGIRDFSFEFGQDGISNLNGQTMVSQGNRYSVTAEFFDGSVEFTPFSATGIYTFKVRNDTGMTFQLGISSSSGDQETFGIPALDSSELGQDLFVVGGLTVGGFLNSVGAGRENDLFNDPKNALTIIDAALSKVSDVRAFLGAFDAFNIQPAIKQMEVHEENLVASESTLRDLDFAQETAIFTRNQILFQAGTAVIAQANAIPQTVLQLLQ